MKIALYYSAVNAKGSSAAIVAKIQEKAGFAFDALNITEGQTSVDFARYDVVIFLIATYGDQELQDDFENFLITLNSSIETKQYIICELGNYYGYEDFTTGAGAIVKSYLVKQGATNIMPITSIDTLPLIDWNEVNWWIEELNKSLI